MDAQTGKHVFHDCIKGFLKDRVVILATNQLTVILIAIDLLTCNYGRCWSMSVRSL